MKIIKNYKSIIILLCSIVIGGIVGLLLGEKAAILSPLGDLFLNMLLIVVVPLIFLTITSSIYKMKQPKRLGRILLSTFGVFIFTSLVALFIGLVSTYSFKLVDTKKGELIKESLSIDEKRIENENINFIDKTVQTISVNDFSKLLSRDNMIALIFVSVLVGIAMHMSKEKALPFYNFIVSADGGISDKTINIINKYVDMVVSGSFITDSDNYQNRINLLK